MDLQSYREHRQKLLEQEPKFRELCLTCLKPQFGCYCPHVQKLDAKINFVILIHYVEMRRRIATGKMSHMCLEGSHLILGHDFTDNKPVNDLIEDTDYYSVILYPGRRSNNLSEMSDKERTFLFPKNKKLRIFVIDGTWNTARTMMNHSDNLKQLPMICFTPDRPSNFRVRKQPHENCYSTIEAIHQTIELVGPTQGFDINTREHDKLIQAFDSMVDTQLKLKR